MFRRKNSGLTLIELLIAMLLSSMVLLTAYSLLNYQQHYFAKHKQQIEQEQNKRFAQFILSNAIRQAGFLGCRSLANSKITNHLSNNKSLAAIFAYQAIGNSWRPALPSGIKVKSGTDVLAVVYENPTASFLSAPMLSPADNITLDNTLLFNAGDTVVISDCEQADIFLIKKINGYKRQLQISTPLSKTYASPTEVSQLMHYLFYVQPDDTLYMLDNSKIPESLVEHIDSLKFLFAMQDSPSNYITANAVSNWSQVHSVKVELPDYSFITSLRNQ